MTKEKILQTFEDINHAYNDCTRYDTLKRMLDELQEPCEDAISRQAAIDAIYACYIGGKEAVDKAPANDQYAEGIDEAVCAVEDLPPVTPQPKTEWIPVSKDLPKDFGTYLITLESGDVCKCEFNPDFIDEEHENGAFTYYHQYFDPATLGLIDGEDEAVDAIAWMPFEPYDPQEEGIRNE